MMKTPLRLSFSILVSLAISFTSEAQSVFFHAISESSIKQTFERRIIPKEYFTTTANTTELKDFLWSLPAEKTIIYNHNISPVIELPMPDGSNARFHVWGSSVQEPGLETKFPEIRTFAGQGIDDRYASIRLDYTDFGFHAQIMSVHGNIYIDPYSRGNTSDYISYFTHDNIRKTAFSCLVGENAGAPSENIVDAGPCRGTELYAYRLAVACTGEYAAAVGGTTAALLHSAIVTSVNRVVGVYEQEFAIRMVLIANNNLLEFLTPAADPFTDGANNDGGTLIGESQNVITNIIGTANFDIGHTFSTGGGGLAGLGVVCDAGSKASGVTGLTNPVGDNYDIDYVAHEMGHQFGGNHTFNSNAGSCNGNRNGGTAYEVGSGTTIMAYAGICANDDTQPHSDPFFHTVSFDEASNYAEAGGDCRLSSPNGNSLPVITSMGTNNLVIPVNTPFTLTGTATDADGDALTYCWEEWDKGPTTTWNGGATSPTAPLFKSRPAKISGSRTFPDISLIAANYVLDPNDLAGSTMNGNKGETLPTVARVMKFRLTVRDNRAGGGGVVTGGNGCQPGFTGTFQVSVSGSTPFIVAVPNGGESYVGGTTQTITWNAAGTAAAPFSVSNVMISLSTDGGQTYPTIILASTSNDGSEPVTMPAIVSATARIKVEAIGNVFFDISNANFSITAAPAGYTFNSVAPSTVSCGTQTSADISLSTTSQGSFTTPITLTASGNPAGTSVSFSVNPLTPGNTTLVTLNNVNILAPGTYNINITGTAGTVTQTGVITYVIAPGTAPSITMQPTSVVVCSGNDAIFDVSASGTGLSYQWQVNTGAGFIDIAGATANTYTLSNAGTTDNNNQYQVIVSTVCANSTSVQASLTVNTPPVITLQPTAVASCAGSTVSFSTVATGTGLTYQWQVSTTGCAGPVFTDLVSQTNPTLSLTGLTTAQNGNAYRCIITGICPPAQIISDCVALTVNSALDITTSPEDATVCSGSNVTFNAVVPGTAVNYQWQVNSGAGFTNIAGAISSTLELSSVAASLNGSQYQVLVTSTSCTTPVASEFAVLSVNPSPVVTLTETPANTSLSGQNPVVLTANVVPAGLYNFLWEKNNVPINNAGSTLSLSDRADTGIYAVSAVSSQSCTGRSNVILLKDSVRSSHLYIYPNPNNGVLTVELSDPVPGISSGRKLMIFDSHGSKIYDKSFVLFQLNQKLVLDLRPAAAGTYVLVIFDEAGSRLASEKVVVSR